MTRYKLVILGLLKEQPMHGYQINREIKRRSMDVWANINMVSIYNTLKRHADEACITSKKERTGKMPVRKVYTITEKGIKELTGFEEDGLSRIIKHNNVVFLLSVGFMTNIPREKTLTVLKEREKKIKSILSEVKELHQVHDGNIPFNWMYIIESSIKHIEIDLHGTKRLITQVETYRINK